MRIVSGSHKGRKIKAPNNLPIRPTTDMSKESIFNILANLYEFNEISVIDLFSGSGNISYEFASRGTTNIVSIDNNINCIKFIKKTSKELDINISAIKSDVINFLKKTEKTSDIIFSDPPYSFNETYLNTMIELIFSKNLINQDGILIIEHSKDISLELSKYFFKKKRYGSCYFTFLKKQSECH